MRDIHAIDVVSVILERVDDGPFECSVTLNGEAVQVKAIGGYNPNIDIISNGKKLCLFDLDAESLESLRSQIRQVPFTGGV